MQHKPNAKPATKQVGALAAALALNAKYGWHLFPADVHAKKSYKSKQYSNGRNWGMTNDPEEIQRDFTRWMRAGIGIPTGPENKIWVLDVDTVAGHGVDGLTSLKQLKATYGPLPPTLQARSPTGSLHYYFQWPDDGATIIRNTTSTIAPGIDVRGAGGMVLAPPTVRPDGAYSWVNDYPIAKAPDRWIALVRDDAGARTPGDNPQADPAMLAAAVAVIPNDDIDWENWNKRGMALWRATNGSDEGFAIFDGYSQKSGKYNAVTTRQRWLHYGRTPTPPDSIGAGTIFFLANEADPNCNWLRRYDAALKAKMDKANARGKGGRNG
jgi:hypothetical protein